MLYKVAKLIMNPKLLYLIFFILAITGCKTKNTTAPETNLDNNIKKFDPAKLDQFEYQNELQILARNKILYSNLGLYDIQTLKNSYELRLWTFSAMIEPSILYIIKGKDSLATIFHYQVYCSRSSNTRIIDSVSMESLKPQKITWTKYFDQLGLDSLSNLKTQSTIKNKSFGILDGHYYILEINDFGKYSYLHYTAPEYFYDKDVNHAMFVRFNNRLVKPLMYNGIVNP